ncbi:MULTISPECIES: CPBP family intramembrane glutamic endopeptidase [unclassified Pseudomonas]|uniref:CPBP family intramembrane glutamic endopeptidase n=1 Tax=unclassified Pseudomonas TaxID=196821 RepID=UPI0021C8FC54|nr:MULTISPECIES: CPBP family intramembrane glutamic endopeptidase [unclassified Pseudomonas]MCU1734698.1 CPBP family intramembrane metalloprotease [Pseudomonas sp. 20P_3.2_Bac4]MCU1742977.1 CPBP family intramembrane metalloprotease [Pseudomonas sp. 20P_3.2_Bac5]
MLEEGLSRLSAYLLYLTPGFLLCALWFWLTPKHQAGMRILVLLLTFVLLRDAMTPQGLWSLSDQVQIAFIANPLVLAALGLLSLVLIALLARVAPELWALLVWRRGNVGLGLFLGLLAGLAIGLPLRLYQGNGLDVSGLWLGGLLVLAYGGNALEEVLFRGMLQGHLEQHTSALRAALGGAVAFAACHAFLALSVTQVGWPILAFTLIEGLVCALLRMRYGIFAAIAAHGTAILLIAVPMSQG